MDKEPGERSFVFYNYRPAKRRTAKFTTAGEGPQQCVTMGAPAVASITTSI